MKSILFDLHILYERAFVNSILKVYIILQHLIYERTFVNMITSIAKKLTMRNMWDMHVIYERSFVKSLLIVYILLQMTRSSRSAIYMFAVKVDRLLESVLDDNGNDNYVPKEDFMGEWTTMPEKIGDALFCMRFTYELETRPDKPEQWVQMKTWEIESIEAQGSM